MRPSLRGRRLQNPLVYGGCLAVLLVYFLYFYSSATLRRALQVGARNSIAQDASRSGASGSGFTMMSFSYEHRLHYLYLCLSGLVAGALLALAYVSLQTTLNEQRKDDLKVLQRGLEFVAPAAPWNYSNSWQPIGDPALKHRLYSAYFDFRTEVFDRVDDDPHSFLYGSLRVFAILPRRLRDPITCLVRQQDFSVTAVAALEAGPLHEHHEARFAAFGVVCPLRAARNASSVLLPLSVALSYGANARSRTRPTHVPISYPKQLEAMLRKSRPQLAVCVGPLQQGFADALALVEFVELYRVLGAERFYFYWRDAGPAVGAALAHYRALGVAEVLAWNTTDYGDEADGQLHYAGIVAQFNDCVFRAMVVEGLRYAAVVDLDELLLPLKHNSLAAFLRQCDEGRTSGFVFRNVFYHRRDAGDLFTVPPHARNRRLFSQTKVRRSVEVLPAHQRSKCVVNTRAVLEMGNHQVWRALPGYAESVVHPSVGLLQHYRDKCINCKAQLVVDFAARRLGSLLWDRVDEACLQAFPAHGGLCPTA